MGTGKYKTAARKSGWKRALAASVAAGCGAVFVALPAVAAGTHRAATAHARRTPPDSYLQYKVYTVDQLIDQVSTNAAVRKRFANHFHIPESRVVSYMRANLVESYVPATARYTVYCVHPSGKFFPVRQTFPRGTKVFALRNGEPVMKWLCGNPLSRFLPEVQVHTVSQPHPPITIVSPSIEELTPSESASMLIPSEVPAFALQPRVPAFRTATIFRVPSPSTNLLPLLGLVLVPLSVHNNSTPIPAVPEPGTLGYLAVGAPIALLAYRRRRGQARIAK